MWFEENFIGQKWPLIDMFIPVSYTWESRKSKRWNCSDCINSQDHQEAGDLVTSPHKVNLLKQLTIVTPSRPEKYSSFDLFSVLKATFLPKKPTYLCISLPKSKLFFSLFGDITR